MHFYKSDHSEATSIVKQSYTIGSLALHLSSACDLNVPSQINDHYCPKWTGNQLEDKMHEIYSYKHRSK